MSSVYLHSLGYTKGLVFQISLSSNVDPQLPCLQSGFYKQSESVRMTPPIPKPSRYLSVGNVRFLRNAGSRQQLKAAPNLRTPVYTLFSDFLMMKDHSEVCTLSGQGKV